MHGGVGMVVHVARFGEGRRLSSPKADLSRSFILFWIIEKRLGRQIVRERKRVMRVFFDTIIK